MLCFWDLTTAEWQAYIPSVGRVPEKFRKRRRTRVEATESASQSPWLEAHRQSTRSYRHRHSDRQLGAPDVAQLTAAGELIGESGGKAGGRQEVGRPADARTQGDHLFEQSISVSGCPAPRKRAAPTAPPLIHESRH
jgi:hypothetical protein